MAQTETATRNRTANPRRGRRRMRSWQRRLIVASIAATLVSTGALVWHPPFLQRALMPWWTTLGPASLLVPIWAGALYFSLRRDPAEVGHQWRWWAGTFFALAAVEAFPNAVGGLSIGWVPFDSRLGADLAGSPGFIGLLRVLLFAGISTTLLFPHFVWRATLAGGRQARHGVAVGSRVAWRKIRRRRGAAAVADGTEGTAGAPTGRKAKKPKSKALPAGDDGPRIILPALAAPETEVEPEPDPGVGTSSNPETAGQAAEPAGGDPTDPFEGLPRVHWRLPSGEMFVPEPPQQIDHEAHLQTAAAIEATLGEYGIEGKVTEIRPGPTVTLYGIRPGWSRRFKEIREKDATGNTVTRREEVGKIRVKVDRIAGLDKDLALQLRAQSIRIESPIPGTNLIGIEVPNPEPQLVVIRSLLQSEVFRRMRGRTKMPVPLGKGSGGEAVVADLAKMPHLLIAGATGSGKSVFINILITSLLANATPKEVRLLMIDPKRVELSIYDDIPHLLTPVIVDTSKVVNALRWLVLQMEERLKVLSEAGVRDIATYNRKREEADRMPYLVLIVDELADLMMTAGKAVEQGLVRLAQMGRATGIHLVVATQRPSVNVVTGLIKANFPTRISFMVVSQVDSRTILDGGGAEKLLGRGDMLYLPQEATRPRRIQGAYVSEEEAEEVISFWRTQAGTYKPPELPELLTPEDLAPRSNGRGGMSVGAADETMERAREMARTYNGRVSTSLLQRRLGIGYPRAARIRDLLVDEGLASPDGSTAGAETQGRSRHDEDEDPPF